MLGVALLGVIALFIVFSVIVARADNLAFFAPKSTRGISATATQYCGRDCRLADGRCPLSESRDPAPNCPLWKFVEADLPTSLYGSPFADLQTS